MKIRALFGALCFLWATSIQAAAPDSPDYRKYAPDRKVDIINVIIDIAPDFTNETISATTTLTFKPIARPIREWILDAEELRISEVTGSARIAAFNSNDKRLTITFAEDLPIDREQSVKIVYT